MPAKISKMIDLKSQFKKALSDVHEVECKEAAKEIEREGRRLRNLTLDKRRPATGFAAARVRIDKKIIKTNRGCIIEMHFLVADGSSRKPHRIWHIINRGRKSFVAKKTTRFRGTKAPRTGTDKSGNYERKLEVTKYAGEGDWVIIPRGKRYGKIRGRHFYDETVARLKKQPLRRAKYKFLEVTTFEVDNG